MRGLKIVIGCIFLSCNFCSCTNAEQFQGQYGYDHLEPGEQIIYEQLYSDFSRKVYESVIKAESGMDLYNAYGALSEDFGTVMDMPDEIVVLEEKKRRGDRITYTLRYIFRE